MRRNRVGGQSLLFQDVTSLGAIPDVFFSLTGGGRFLPFFIPQLGQKFALFHLGPFRQYEGNTENGTLCKPICAKIASQLTYNHFLFVGGVYRLRPGTVVVRVLA